MVLFAALVKVFSIHRERDYVYLGVLSFGMVLAAAVLTVDSLFFAMFCLFVLLAITTLVSMEMRRSWIAAQATVPNLPLDFRDLRRLPGSVLRGCALLVLSIVVGTVALFFLIPRKPSAGYLSTLSSRNDLSTGFSEDVRLGDIGRIQQSGAVVMHVKFAPGTLVPRDLRWRGVALTTFDGRRWTGPGGNGDLQPIDANWPLRFIEGNARMFAGRAVRIRYKVSLEPFGSRVFFLLPEAQAISGNYLMLRIDSTGSVFNADESRAITDYSATSELPPPPSRDTSFARGLRGIDNTYLQVPPNLDRRVIELAERITSTQGTLFLKASALERYLATSYGYTLQLPAVTPKDPVASFLFERKSGHCEYFASSMVIMLRALGIPSRIVNGFRGGEYNHVTGSYIVRARDAHSWVEAYFQGYGWYTFDPTPSSASASGSWNRVYLYVDAMREFWHDWVVNYDTRHQNVLSVVVVRQGHVTFEKLRKGLAWAYGNSLRQAKALRMHFQQHLQGWTLWIGAVGSVVFVLLIGPKIFLALWRMRLARTPSLAPQTAATVWYERLLRLLSRRGLQKLPNHTPEEFLNTIQSHTVRQRVESFTHCYERARFGDSAEAAEELPKIFIEIQEIRKRLTT